MSAILQVPHKRRLVAAGLMGAGLFLGAPSAAMAQPADDPLNCEATARQKVEAGDSNEGYVYCRAGPSGEQFSFSTTSPSHGVVSDTRVVDDQYGYGNSKYFYYTYTASAAYQGPDGFKVNASRGGETASVDVSFDVSARVNDPPRCGGGGTLGLYPVFEGYRDGEKRRRFPAGKPVVGRLECTDDENGPLSFAFLYSPVFGSVSDVRFERVQQSNKLNGVFTLTPDAGYSGPDDFTLRASDGANCVNVTLPYMVPPAKKHPGGYPFLSPNDCGPPAPRPPLLSGRSAAAAARASRKGSFVLPKHLIVCAGAGPACRVKMSVTATARANFARTLRIGKSSFKLAAEKRRKVKGKLSRKGRAWLKLARSWRAKVKITIRRGAATPAKKTIRVTLKAPK